MFVVLKLLKYDDKNYHSHVKLNMLETCQIKLTST